MVFFNCILLLYGTFPRKMGVSKRKKKKNRQKVVAEKKRKIGTNLSIICQSLLAAHGRRGLLCLTYVAILAVLWSTSS